MKVVGLQETKWFGCDVYDVAGSVVLTVGRAVPDSNDSLQRGEGVALVLLGSSIDAWKAGGQQWKAWSSRLVTACLKIGNKSLHVASCYALTRSVRREEKDRLYDKLGSFIDGVPDSDVYILLEDFNARIGSREQEDDPWGMATGPHELGNLNDSSKELLNFLNTHQITV